MRAIARETAFKIIFASFFTGEIDMAFARRAFKSENLDKDDIEYAERVLSIVNEHSEDFSALLDKYSHAFPEARIFPADKSVLYLALAEIKYMDDVPDAVTANEAANIASKYSSEKSAGFVNGILGEIMRA